MKIEKTEINQCVREITVTIPAEDIRKDYHSYIKKNSRYFAVPGFRPGKAPIQLIIRNFGEKAKEVFVQEKIRELTKKVSSELTEKPLTEVVPYDYKWEENESFSLELRYDIFPDIELKKYTGLDVEHNFITVTDEKIEDELNNLLKNNAEINSIDGPIREGDLVKVKMKIADTPEELEKKLESAEELERVIEVSKKLYGEELDLALLNKSVNDELKTVIKFTQRDAPKDYEKYTHLHILGVERTILPDLNDDFAKDLEYDSLDDLKSDIKRDLEEKVLQENDNALNKKIFAEIYKQNKFDIPPSLVNSRADELSRLYAGQSKKDANMLYNYFLYIAEEEISHMMIRNKLLEMEKFDISEEFTEMKLKSLAKNMNMTLEEYKEKYQDDIKSENFVNFIRERRLFEFLKENNKIVPEKKESKEDKDMKDEVEVVEEKSSVTEKDSE